jgi:hypothetical protein
LIHRHGARGYRRHLTKEAPVSKHESDNHSNQLNYENDAYWQSRGFDERPDDYEDKHESGDTAADDK